MSDSFSFFPENFLTGTAEMTAEEVGGYIRLLCYCWAKNGLPDDDSCLSRLSGCSGNAVAIIRSKFVRSEDGKLRNMRLEMERLKEDSKSRKQRQKAIQRWRCPQSDESRAIAALYRRALDREWNEKEIAAFRKLQPMNMDDLRLVVRYTEFQRSRGKDGIHRRDMQTFLNNYDGEVDRAKQWAATSHTGKPQSTNGDHEPDGFRPWYAQAYPTEAHRPWKQIPESIRLEYRRTAA